MRVELSIVQKEASGLPRKFFLDVARRALDLSGIEAVTSADIVSLGVALVPLEEIRELNRQYRKKDRPTDILSFGEYKNRHEVRAEEGRIELGDLVIAPAFIEAAAEEDGVTLEVEMAFIFSHGIFHLLGFRHSPRMFRLQDEIAVLYGKRHIKTL